MIDSSTTFLKRLKGIAFSKNERLMLREQLAAYADMHPALDAHAASSRMGRFFLFIESRRFSSYAMALLLIVAAGGGVTLAADTSVPGDSLYSIKIHVNEPLLTALTPTATGQAKVAAEIATRRVDEAVTLATRGELTPERQTYLTQEFDARAKIAATKADTLASLGDSVGSDNARATFAANLAGEAQALGAVTTKDSAQSADLMRAVVATSEGITSNGSDDSIASAASVLQTDTSTSTTPVSVTAGTNIEHAALMVAKVGSGTTTPQAAARISKHLRINVDSLHGRLAPSFTTSGFMTPKTDVAIPSAATPQTQTGSADTGTASVHISQ